MLNNYCLVCSDVNSFNGKVFQLENILKRLRIIVEKAEYQLPTKRIQVNSIIRKEVCRGVANDTNSVHMMCGVCHKVDTNKIRQIDDNVHGTIIKICYILKDPNFPNDKFNKIKHETLECLRGYYSMSYRFLEHYLCL